MRPRLFIIFAVALLALTATVIAQDNDGSCPTIVETALNAIDEFCADTGRNQACYGNFNLQAEAQPDAEDFNFQTIGDIEDVNDILSLRLNGMNEDTGEWGVALLRLQTSLPDTVPGQNVTFILFGDVEVTNATDEASVEDGTVTPMQSFYLTTGVGDAGCEEAPESGMLVQTPEGVGNISFTVNEVDVEMGSTVMFQAQEEGDMIVTTVEGAAVLRMDEEEFPIIAGTQARMPLRMHRPPNGGPPRFRPERLPEQIETYTEGHIRPLPIHHLPRQIEMQAPLPMRELLQVRRQHRDGGAMCGEHPFPPCEHLPPRFGGNACVLPSRAEQMPPEELGDRPICNIEELDPSQLPLRDEDNIGDQLPPPPDGENIGDQLPPPPDGENIGGQLPPPPDGDGSRLPPPPDGDGSRLPPPPDGDGSRLPPPPDGDGSRLPPPPDGDGSRLPPLPGG